MDPVRVIFIGGSHRSGSTLLERILDQLPEYCSVGELVQVWTSALEGTRPCGCGTPFLSCAFWTAVGVRAFGGWDRLDLPGIVALQRSVDRTRYLPFLLAGTQNAAYAARLKRYTGHLTALYRAISDVSGLRVVVDSTKRPSTAFVLARTPMIDLRLVHLIRDSRGVAHSWSRPHPEPGPPGEPPMAVYRTTSTAPHWDMDNLLLHHLRRRRLPAAQLLYESLVTAPSKEIARVLRAVDTEPSVADLEFLQGDGVLLRPGHSVAGNPFRFLHGRVTIHRDERWHREMTPGARMFVLASTFPLLLRYGYLDRGAHGGG